MIPQLDNSGSKFQDFEGDSLLPRNIVALSPCWRRLEHLINRTGVLKRPVLIEGGSGTGKEILSHAVHHRFGKRKPFVVFDCAAAAETLLEAQLFGYEKGAFTGAVTNKKGAVARAKGGTLVLDEINSLSKDLQGKLLRVIQADLYSPLDGTEVSADVKIVGISNVSLVEEVNAGKFRLDLYHRFVDKLVIPPLKERPEDIKALLEFFLRQSPFSTNERRHQIRLTEDLGLNTLLSYHWPGNVREMQNAVERALSELHGNDCYLTTQMIADQLEFLEEVVVDPAPAISLAEPNKVIKIASPPPQGRTFVETVRVAFQEREVKLIEAALNKTHWQYKKAAQLLEMDYKAFLYRTARYEIKERPYIPSDDLTESEIRDGYKAMRVEMIDAEKQLLVEVLNTAGGNHQKAAELLGITKRALSAKKAKYGLTKRPLDFNPLRTRVGKKQRE